MMDTMEPTDTRRGIGYVAAAGELALLRNAYERRTPVLLLGPTGCGKTLLIEELAADLARPLTTVTCHDDLTTADLVGRHLIQGGDVVWQDGPLTTAMRTGGICYLDEIVEARADTLAMVHSVADHRRTLYVDRLDAEIAAAPEFMLVASYNPRGAGSPKELKPALRQRFAVLRLDYLPPTEETQVVAARSGADTTASRRLVAAANLIREAAARATHDSYDPPSTRTLITAGGLIAAGTSFDEALEACVLGALAADEATVVALRELVAASADGAEGTG